MEIRNRPDETSSNKGVLTDKRLRLWDEYFPLNNKNSPSVLIAPMPMADGDHVFASYSVVKKIAVIIGWTVVALTVLACAVSYFVSGF